MSKQQTDSPFISLEQLLEAGVHFGHQAKRWHPKIAPYIWQARDGVHIFDLIKTVECLQKACEAIKQDVAAGKTIAYVATKRQAATIVREEAQRAGVSFITARWPGGLITNWEQIKKSVDRLRTLKTGLEKGTFNDYTKKERVLMDKEMNRLNRIFGGIIDLQKPPDVLFIIDVNREKSALAEAKHNKIKLYAIVDSNVNPGVIDYPIPGNDDAVRSVSLLVSKFTDAIIEGKELTTKKVEVTK